MRKIARTVLASYVVFMPVLLSSCSPEAVSDKAMFSSPSVSRQVFSPLQDNATKPTSTININPDFNQKPNF